MVAMSQHNNLIEENPADFEGERLQLLQQILDSHTQRRFERLGIQQGWRCLEVGAGEGSVARWLAQKVGTRGTVVATDIETRGLEQQQEPNLVIRRHDILSDELEQDYYDVVHTRAVLMHLSDPVQAVNKMAAAVRPGGWLFLEEFDAISFGAVDADSPTAQAFNQKMETMLQTLKAVHIMDIYFGRHLRRLLEQPGFIDIENEGITSISHGGDPDTQFQLMTLQLAGPPLVAAGVLTEQDVDLLRQLFADPSFYYVGSTFFGAWGRRSH
jgi:2-polyprenyl-3-methyl-5-hydroxy-6-metoxy-1,4-benzoquinol methylase